MHSPRAYCNNIGSICTDSLRHGNGLSALLLLTRAAKSSAAKKRAKAHCHVRNTLSVEPKQQGLGIGFRCFKFLGRSVHFLNYNLICMEHADTMLSTALH